MFRALALALLLTGCATTPAASTVEATLPPIPTTIAFEGLYGGSAHRSRYPGVPPDTTELRRWRVPDVMLDPHADGTRVEPWTFELLQDALGTYGVTLHAVVDPPASDEVQPTMELRHVDFASGTDAFPVLVRADGDTLRLTLRRGREESLCDDELHVDLGFVILRGALLRLHDGSISAMFDQFNLVEAAGEGRVTAPLPTTDDPRFCAELQALLDESEVFAPNDRVFVAAARVALESALAPLFRESP